MNKGIILFLVLSFNFSVEASNETAENQNVESVQESSHVGFELQTSNTSVETIQVTGRQTEDIEVIKANNAAGGDTLRLLRGNPAVQFQTGGGISSLPVIHGMASDRVNVKVDGSSISASCPNHMNPALSYVTTNKVDVIEAIAGIVPVSQGGDSLGGSIIAKSKRISFAKESENNKYSGHISTYYGSNEDMPPHRQV